MIVLGIDPGTHRCGYSVVESAGSCLRLLSYGVFDTSEKDKKMAPVERLARIKEGVLELVRRFGPGELAIEKLFINRNVNTAVSVGESRGVVLLTCHEAGMSVNEYTPQQIKSNITGYGAAPKEQVQMMVKAILKLHETPKPDDAADAIACAICHIQTMPYKNAVNLSSLCDPKEINPYLKKFLVENSKNQTRSHTR